MNNFVHDGVLLGSIKCKKLIFYTMKHRGGLDEALKTRKRISEQQFKIIFQKYGFEYYAYDCRINCIRFIISDMCKYVNVSTWLLIEVVDNEFRLVL